MLVVADGPFEDHGRVLAANLGLPFRTLDSLGKNELATGVDVVVDVHLQLFETVAGLKRAFGTAPRKGARIFLIEPEKRVSRVQAEALGASGVVDRENAVMALLKANLVERLGARSLGRRSISGKAAASIEAAGNQLAELFDGLVSNKPIDMDALGFASSRVLDGVATVGATDWLGVVREHHQGTFQHCLLVAGVTARYAQRARLIAVQSQTLVNAAMLHDIGKAVVPLAILDKVGQLTDAEMAVVRLHPVAGYDYLRRQPGLPATTLDLVLHHHEYLDGSGYPDRLSGAAIPPLTRILTACDVFAALIEARAYKPSLSPADALKVMVGMAAMGRLDPTIVATFATAFEVQMPDAPDVAYRRA